MTTKRMEEIYEGSFDFTLVLAGPKEITRALEDAVHEAGLDDATLGSSEGEITLDVCREAETLAAAIRSAVVDALKLPGTRVAEVRPAEAHIFRAANRELQAAE